MKALQIISILLALHFTSLCQEYIKLDYVGPVKKPFQTLIVSTKEISDTQRFTFVTGVLLDSDSYSEFKKIIVENLPSETQRAVADFGCFCIFIKKNKDDKVYYLNSKEKSIKYFKKILAAMKKDSVDTKINESVETYLKRIGG